MNPHLQRLIKLLHLHFSKMFLFTKGDGFGLEFQDLQKPEQTGGFFCGETDLTGTFCSSGTRT
ncbi:hypothetical protein EXN66_Car006167 [Channa argus]|uniref:Uncharacterized protein n=1 Tax=Channa argus TaxID=215402 RepID=A0A6G1PK32_CHAAH|nr:hypothetical protein EXN66_Car006167 [Channa argus]